MPGVLGNADTLNDESYSGNADDLDYVEHPQYTKPSTFVTEDGEEWTVPDVLLSGNHAEIDKWRKERRKDA